MTKAMAVRSNIETTVVRSAKTREVRSDKDNGSGDEECQRQ